MERGRGRETGDEGSERYGEGFSWNHTVWHLVATVRPLHFTLREMGVIGGLQSEDLQLKRMSLAAVWRTQWGYKSGCRRGNYKAPAGIQERADGGAGGSKEGPEVLTFWILC